MKKTAVYFQIVLGLAIALSACSETGTGICDQPEKCNSVSTEKNTERKTIPTYLVLPTEDGKEIILNKGQINLLRDGEVVESNIQLTGNGNQLSLKQQNSDGNYTYQGQGTIKSVVPIGSTQEGLVPIGSNVVPISGSQGGFHTLVKSDEIKPDQPISFEGKINQDLRQPLRELRLDVPVQNIQIGGDQNITVNQGDNTNTGNGNLVNNTGSGTVIINNGGSGSQTEKNNIPVIIALSANPTQTSFPKDKISMTIKAIDKEGDLIDYTWSATKGLLSATKGTSVFWQPLKSDLSDEEPGLAIITVVITDNQSGSDRADINILIEENGGALVQSGTFAEGAQN